MRFSRLFLPLLALSFLAAASKPKLTIRFHTETNPNSGASFAVKATMPDSSTLTISKIPEITEKDIVAIFPFPSADGSMGCAFRLDNHGRLALTSLSEEYRGSLLIGFVNARPVTAMLIDSRISDGVITIPRGMTPSEIALMKKTFPTLGEKKNTKANPKEPEAADAMPNIAVPPPLRIEPSGLAPRGD
ncbi:MAG: hypothetical protein NTZ46_01825 [Verrucomicrobia bacterium]|nr:hypothetical protein [Verrucomicrobiota bacterium]